MKNGADTLADLAHGCAYAPGAPATFDKFDAFVVKILGKVEHAKMPALRRLFHDAYAMSAAHKARLVSATPADSALALPVHEREARREALQLRLKSIEIEGPLVPSYSLLDRAHELFDRNVIKSLEWAKCTTRQQELRTQKEDTMVKKDSAGYLREVRVEQSSEAKLSDTWALRGALTHRGLALDIARVLDFETHELWVDVAQLEATDRAFWDLCSERCRGGVHRNEKGELPFAVAMRDAMFEPEVRFRMTWLPIGSRASSSSSAGATAHEENRGEKRKLARMEVELHRLRTELAASRANSAAARAGAAPHQVRGGQRKAQSKGAGRQMRKTVPQALIDKQTTTADGIAICWNFNMPVGCAEARAGARCSRGLHVCAEPGCQQPHGLTAHR